MSTLAPRTLLKGILWLLPPLLAVGAAWYWAGQRSQPKEKPAPMSTVKLPVPSATPPPPTPSVEATAATPEARQVLEITDRLKRREAFEQLMRDMKPEQAKEILARLLAGGAGKGKLEAEWNLFWRLLTRRDPEKAAALWAETSQGQPWQGDALNHLLLEWGTMNGEAAQAWLARQNGLPEELHNAALVSLVRGQAKADLQVATQRVLQQVQPNDPLFGAISGALGQAALEKGGLAALQSWFDGLPSDDHRKAAFLSSAINVKRTGPENLNQWLGSQASQPWRDDEVYRSYIEAVAERSPALAMDYFMLLPPSPVTGQYIGALEVVRAWFAADINALATFMKSLPADDRSATLLGAVRDTLNNPATEPVLRQRGALLFGLPTP